VANTKSAAKRARQSTKRNARNKAITSGVRNQIRKAREVMTTKDPAKIDDELRKATRALDKAASKGIVHKRNASRRASRLALAANAAKAVKA